MDKQSWRTPELVRRTRCCKREAWSANGKLWCPGCGQQVLRPSDIWGSFARHPAPPAPPAPPPPIGRRKGLVAEGQGHLL